MGDIGPCIAIATGLFVVVFFVRMVNNIEIKTIKNNHMLRFILKKKMNLSDEEIEKIARGKKI